MVKNNRLFAACGGVTAGHLAYFCAMAEKLGVAADEPVRHQPDRNALLVSIEAKRTSR